MISCNPGSHFRIGSRFSQFQSLARLILIMAAAFLCLDCSGGRSGSHRQVPPSSLIKVKTPFSSVLDSPPQAMAEAVRDSYRLKPDRRFLLAISFLHHSLTEDPKGEMEVTWDGQKWLLRYAGVALGTLRQYPGYSDWAGLIEPLAAQWLQRSAIRSAAKSEKAATPDFSAQVRRFSEESLLDTTREIHKEWAKGNCDPALLASGARAMVRLAFMTTDRAEVGDDLFARAAGLLFLAKRASQEDFGTEESMLAYAMGYRGHAIQMAGKLPDRDLVRAFVTGEESALILEAGKGNEDARFLLLKLLGERQDAERWKQYAFTYYPHPPVPLCTLATGLNLADLCLAQSLPAEASTRVFELMDHLTKPSRIGQAMRRWLPVFMQEGNSGSSWTYRAMERLESDLGSLRCHGESPILDADLYRAFFRAHLYDGLFVNATVQIERLGSTEAAISFAQNLGKPETGVPEEFARWYGDVARGFARQGDWKALEQDLQKGTWLGGNAYQYSFKQIRYMTNWQEDPIPNGAKALARLMDTRPRHLVLMSGNAMSDLSDVGLGEELEQAALLADPWVRRDSTSLQVLHDGFIRDWSHLATLLHAPGLLPEDRAKAFELLVTNHAIDAGRMKKDYEALREETRDSWSVTDSFYMACLANGDRRQGEMEVRAWISRHDASEGFPYIFARNELAGELYTQKRYEEAWLVAEPVIETWQAASLTNGAQIAAKLGRMQEADKLARAAVDRYPFLTWVRCKVAQIFWEQGKYKEVADLFAKSPYVSEDLNWAKDFGDRFFRAFQDSPDAEAIRAWESLLKAGVDPRGLVFASDRFAKKGRYALAFELHSRLDGDNPWNVCEASLIAARYLRSVKGREAASTWLNSRIPPEHGERLTMTCYEVGEYDFLWTLKPDPRFVQIQGYQWLLRAAAWARQGGPAGPRRKELESYFSEEGSNDYHIMGRYLMGMVGERELFALATTPDRRCEVAYYRGVKAEGEGRFEEASSWYRAALETRRTRNLETTWAIKTLGLWVTKNCCLSQLGALLKQEAGATGPTGKPHPVNALQVRRGEG